MEKGRIGLIMAMPEELRPLLSCVGRVCTKERAGSTIHSFEIGRYEVSAIQSGIGTLNGTAAARTIVEQCSPELLLNAGFAGSITGEAAVGDIVLAYRILHYDNGRFDEIEGVDTGLNAQSADIMDKLPNRFRFLLASFVTTTGVIRKADLAAALMPSADVAVVDMETAAVARVAAEKGIPFMAIRAISDGAEEELGFSIEEITDSAFKISLPKIIGTIVRKPWIVPQMARLARNSKRAGGNLAAALQHLLARL